MKRLFSFALVSLLIGSASVSLSQVSAAPTLVNFQGRLATSNGNPVPDGTYSVRFSLWDAASAGTEKWNQTITNVQVKNGTFAVLLNTNTAGLFNGNLWLEIKIGTDAPLSPRQQLVSVPYALKANSVADGSITASSFASGAANGLTWLLGGNSATNPASQFLGTTDNQPLVFRTNNTERMRLLTNGNIGIGTSNPLGTLDVNGNIRSRGGDFILVGRNGGVGNNGNAGRALVDGGQNDPFLVPRYGLILNFDNDYGIVWVNSGLHVDGNIDTNGSLTIRAGGVTFPDGTTQTTAGGNTNWSLNGNGGTNPATQFVGTTDNQPLILRSNNNRLLGLQYVAAVNGGETYTSGNIVGGYWLNSITAGVTGATIAGGGNRYTNGSGSTDSINRVTDLGGTVSGGSGNIAGNNDADLLNGRWATVGGGVNNTAGTRFATVGGGNQNTASGVDATVSGGWLNTAGGLDSTVVGGQGNIANGQGAVIVGGTQNRAPGSYAFAGGTYANAQNPGSFVWGDFSTSSYLNSTADNQFSVRAAGGVRFFTNSGMSAGVALAAGSGGWSNLSDRNAKTNFRPVNLDDLLARLLRVPISTWNYKSQDGAIRHIGPMAQDFFAAFGMGEDERHITTIDADGVALAGVQAVYGKLKGQQQRIEAAEQRVRELEGKNAELEARLLALEKLLDGQHQKR